MVQVTVPSGWKGEEQKEKEELQAGQSTDKRWD